MIRLDREQLLTTLDQLRPGVTRMDTYAQSSCFCFTNGMVVSMQERVSCSLPSPFGKEINGAVPAKKLIDVLGNMKHEQVRVSQNNGHLTIQPGEKKKGEREAARIDMNNEVELPIYLLPSFDHWGTLDPGFCDALKFVSEFGKGRKSTISTYIHMVHLHPDHIEAVNGVQAARWPLKTGTSSCVCLTQDIAPVSWLNVKEVAENDHWISFRSLNGLVYSCRKEDVSSYPCLDEVLEVEGIPITLPKGLVENVGLGEVFSKIDDTHNDLLLTFTQNKFTVTGIGPQGEYTCERDVDYTGPDMEFYMNAGRLRELADRHSECILGKDKVKVETPDYVFVSVLVPTKVQKGGKNEEARVTQATTCLARWPGSDRSTRLVAGPANHHR